MPVHNPNDGRARRGFPYPARRRPRRDLRYAAMLSLGLIGMVLLAGAAITPLVATNEWPTFHSGDQSRGVRLGNAPPGGQNVSERSASLPGGEPSGGGGGGGAGAPVPGVVPVGGAPGAVVAPSRRRPAPQPLHSRAHSSTAQGTFPGTGIAPATDTDGDGLPDSWERFYGTDPNRNDAAGDPDGDGLSHGLEFRMGTHPLRRDSNGDGRDDGSDDSDGDGLSNRFEVRSGSDPQVVDSGGRGGSDADVDPDGDGLSNVVEQELALDPMAADTDHNGIPDGAEDSDGDGFSNL